MYPGFGENVPLDYSPLESAKYENMQMARIEFESRRAVVGENSSREEQWYERLETTIFLPLCTQPAKIGGFSSVVKQISPANTDIIFNFFIMALILLIPCLVSCYCLWSAVLVLVWTFLFRFSGDRSLLLIFFTYQILNYQFTI